MTLPEDLLTDWLISYLEADTTLTAMLNGAEGQTVAPEVIWDRLASPFVRIDRLDGDDLMVIGLHRIWSDTTYHVRGVQHWKGSGRPDRTDVNAIGARIDTLLHDHEETTATLEVHSFREEPEPLPAVTEANGELWLQSGGIFRLRARAL
jgi:hypothetical protein